MADADQELAAVVAPAMATFWRLLGEGSDEGFVIERGSVLGTVSPAAPERSLFNAVMYGDPDELMQHLDELQAAYEGAGVEAWTVWARREDSDLTGELAGRGHVLDATPDALALRLDELSAPDPGDLDWAIEEDVRRVMEINDRAYPWPAKPFTRALGGLPADGWHAYVASVDGEAAACLMTYDADGNTRPELVAALPAARGAGISGRLLGVALGHARERGCATSTIHASKMGQPVYERLGYRVVSHWEMWECRKG